MFHQNQKIMKKLALLTVCLAFTAYTFAQSSFYVSLGVGAGWCTARTYDLANTATKANPVGLGKGFAPVLRAGIKVNDFMAIELGVAYRMGFNTKVNYESTLPVSAPLASTTGWDKYAGGMLQLVPAIVIQPDFDLGSVSPYARVGVLVGIIPNIKDKFEQTTGSNAITGVIKYTGGVSIGGSAAIGCDFDLSDMLALYVEIYYDAMAYSPTKSKVTKFTVNGEDKLGSLKTSQKETKFVKDLTGYAPADDSPSQALKNSFPMNNVGLNFGVKIKI